MTYIYTDAHDKYIKAIEDNIAQRNIFTALDISRIVQKMLKAEGKHIERHRNMKTLIHDLYESGNMVAYFRTLKDVGGKEGPAYVYHHCCDSADSYGQLHTIATISVKITPILTAPQAPQISAPIDRKNETWLNGSKRKMLDKKNRLRFPKKVLHAAGFSTGDVVYLSGCVSGEFIYVTDCPRDGESNKKYTIDCYGNVRADASQYGFESGSEFVFYAAPKHVTARIV